MLQKQPASRPNIDQVAEIVKAQVSQGLANYEDFGIIGRGNECTTVSV
jgi:hypothetical protein